MNILFNIFLFFFIFLDSLLSDKECDTIMVACFNKSLLYNFLTNPEKKNLHLPKLELSLVTFNFLEKCLRGKILVFPNSEYKKPSFIRSASKYFIFNEIRFFFK
jgi:hypothetical protein